VGKSTLLNSIIGEKISIVSRKPQTTRNRIRGVKNLPDAQIIFIDTPGIHRSKGRLNAFMIKEALATFGEVDCVLFMLEPFDKKNDVAKADDLFTIEELKKIKTPVVVVINKIDMVAKSKLLPLMESYAELMPKSEIVPVSALKGEGTPELLEVLCSKLPIGPALFPEDMITDQPERFIVSEIVREKVFKLTHDEIPYSVAVSIEEFSEERRAKGRGLVRIRAVINVERDSQKGIVIGKKGKMLKDIGQRARVDIENLLGVKVFLELFVRVEKDWSRSDRMMREFGYE
jgi:GTP-binding protein Era